MVERWCWHFTGMIRDDGGSWVGEDELDEALAEIERLLGRLHEEMARYAEWRGRAEKAEAERDEARETVILLEISRNEARAERDAAMALLADAYGAGTGGSVIESLLADAERDMRQRAAEIIRRSCPECQGTALRDSGGVYPWGEYITVPCDCADAILSLPLKHADREGGYDRR